METVYYKPTIVTPEIPSEDITPLERLILSQVLNCEDVGDALYFSSELGQAIAIYPSVTKLREAFDASRNFERTELFDAAERVLARYDSSGLKEAEVDFDLDAEALSLESILQVIVKRSKILNEIVIWAAHMCTQAKWRWRRSYSYH